MDRPIYICAIAKNEDRYLKEWIEYHLSIGFDKIRIYDNNDDNRIYDDEDIVEFIINGKLEIIPWKRDVEAPQQAAYDKFLESGTIFYWCLFIDIDEFFDLGEGKMFNNVREFVDSIYKGNVVEINWRVYGANGHREYSDEPLLGRFSTPVSDDTFNRITLTHKYYNALCKPFVSSYAECRFTSSVHSPQGSNVVYTTPNQHIVTTEFNQTNDDDISYDYPYIRHICFKSEDEYLKRIMMPKPDTLKENEWKENFQRII